MDVAGDAARRLRRASEGSSLRRAAIGRLRETMGGLEEEEEEEEGSQAWRESTESRSTAFRQRGTARSSWEAESSAMPGAERTTDSRRGWNARDRREAMAAMSRGMGRRVEG